MTDEIKSKSAEQRSDGSSKKAPLGEVARLSEIFLQASRLSRQKLQDLGFEQEWRSAAEMRAMHEKDYARWRPIIAVLGLQP
jgi:tripartite-type tricarboxylate transporter receptor subunit TctC